MALSESGLAAQGIFPGPMIVQTQGGRRVIAARKGPARAGRSAKTNYYVRSKSSRKGAGSR